MRLFVDNITNVDFSYLCPERGLVGETWLAHLELEGSLDQQGMICDFGLVKKRLREWLDKNIDHCLLVPALSDAISTSTDALVTRVELECRDGGQIQIEAPPQAITLVQLKNISPELVSQWCVAQLREVFGAFVAEIQLSFSTETIETPYYHYSHGLKKHDGHCQRIAHGHRSKLLVWRNNALCSQSMQKWAKQWQDIYIGTKEDCVYDDGAILEFAYRARQGQFRLRIPKKHCYLIDRDSTVEHLALHLAESISHQYPDETIRVKAFEGMGKGAIVEVSPSVSNGTASI